MANIHNNLSDLFSAIANAIRNKTGKEDQIIADKFPDEITNIQTGIDTSDATAVAADIQQGKTAYAKGLKITGTSVSVDTTDGTAVASDIKSGKVAYSKGTKITGSMPTQTLPTPTISVNSSGTITATESLSNAGYYNTGSKSATLKLSSSQDSDFVASNIKSGVTIFGVTGTLETPAQPVRETLDRSDVSVSIGSATITLSQSVKELISISGHFEGSEYLWSIGYPTNTGSTSQLYCRDDSDSTISSTVSSFDLEGRKIMISNASFYRTGGTDGGSRFDNVHLYVVYTPA